ncbi:MAG: helix-turn-helix domain-containing protein [Oscillospiraceae bacterium]
MTIADKILHLRKKNNLSQEELAEKLNVSRQSVSKWESATSVPDINKIMIISRIFSVSTDYLLKDNLETTEILDIKEKEKLVTIEEVNTYINIYNNYSKKVSVGVILCILSPSFLIFLTTMSNDHNNILKIERTTAIIIGFIWLFLSISIAVKIFVFSDSLIESFKYIENKDFELSFGVKEIIKEKQKKEQSPKQVKMLTLSIISFIIGGAPVAIATQINVSDVVVAAAIVNLLCFVAFGVSNLIISQSKKECYNKLLFENELKKTDKSIEKKNDKIKDAYWSVVIIIYLLWSFSTNDWSFTWIVWPTYYLFFNVVKVFLIKD